MKYSRLKLVTAFMLLSLGLAAPASATGGVYCISKDKQVEISVGMGRVVIYAPINAYLKYGEQEWVFDPQHGEKEIGGSQGMWGDDELSIDLADGDILKIIASLRVDYSDDEEDDEGEYPGTLTFEDGIEHSVFCSFE